MEKKLILESDYQKGKDPIPVASVVHAIIESLNVSISPKDLTYKHLKPESIGECLDLEKEWFPGDPLAWYYTESLQRKTCFTLCCYWRPQGQRTEYVVAFIVVKVFNDCKAMKHLSNGVFKTHVSRQEQAENAVRNGEKTVAYVCSIGVVDEARRLGIGSKLIELAAQYAASNYPNCVGISLNVISTGVRAIGLYEKCKFVRLFTVPRYYEFDGKKFDAYYYAKTFDKNENKKNNIVAGIQYLLLNKVKGAVNKAAELNKKGMQSVDKLINNERIFTMN